MLIFDAISAILIVAEVSDNTSARVEQVVQEKTPKFNATKITSDVQDKYGYLNVNPADVPPMNQSEIMLRDMCERNGNPDSYQEAQVRKISLLLKK